MPKVSKLSPAKKIVVVGLVLVVAEVVFIFVFSGNKPKSVSDAIASSMKGKATASEGRKSQLKIQVAVNTYRAAKGRLPNSLTELVPDFLDVVPIDPDSGKAFEYRLEDGKPIVGSRDEPTVMAASNTGGKLGKSGLSAAVQAALIESLTETDENEKFVYNAKGKRDPFIPFNLAPPDDVDNSKSPLERLTVGQLKLTAVLDGFDEPAAIVETEVGKGYTIRKGTKIGVNGGEVVDILPDRILILESLVDFTGQRTNRTVTMKLRVRSGESDLGTTEQEERRAE